MEETKETWFETLAYGEPAFRLLNKGDIIQIQRRGFYIIDKPYMDRIDDTCSLIFIPDGKSQAMSALSQNTNKVEISTR